MSLGLPKPFFNLMKTIRILVWYKGHELISIFKYFILTIFKSSINQEPTHYPFLIIRSIV